MRPFFFSPLFLITILTSCINRAEPEIHLIPKDFQGPIIIIYEQKDGKPKKYEGDFRVYEIPGDGVLRTQFTHPKGFIAPGKLQYYYYEKNTRQQLLYIESPKDAKDDGKPHTFSTESSDQTIRYLVGYLSRGDDYYNHLRKKIDTLFPAEIQ